MKSIRLVSLLLLLTASALAQSNPVPFLYQTSPVSTRPGSKGFMLTVSGTGFRSGAVVNWNGSPRQTTFISQGQVQAAISAADVAKARTASVTAVNGTGSVASNVLYFPIRKPSSTVSMKNDWHSLPTGAIAVGDFNTDGNLDVVIDHERKGQSGYRGTLETYLGKGNGAFKLSQSIRHVDSTYELVTGDFNDDGNLDALAAVVYQQSAPIQVFLGTGHGRFGAPVNTRTGGGPAMVTADLNGDGQLDLAAAVFNPTGNALCFSQGNGHGSFSPMGHCFDNLNATNLVAVGDFNQDGILDLAQPQGKSINIYLGKGDGTFQDPVLYQIPYSASAVAAVDLDGDGKLDLVTDGLTVLLGNGDGTFKIGQSIQMPSYPASQNVNIGDFNGDGKLDAAVVSVDGAYGNGNQTVSILLGNGDGTFQNPIQFAGGVNTTRHDYGFFMGDLNNDGKLDLILEQTVFEKYTHLFLQK